MRLCNLEILSSSNGNKGEMMKVKDISEVESIALDKH